MLSLIYNNIKENYDYYAVIVVCLTASALIINYKLYLEYLEKNKTLENNYDLIDYANSNLAYIFKYKSVLEIDDDFLNSQYLYNFFLNLVRVLPQLSSIFFDVSFNDQFAINDFFNFIKTNPSYEEFKKYKMSKKVFFDIILSIKKNLFHINYSYEYSYEY